MRSPQTNRSMEGGLGVDTLKIGAFVSAKGQEIVILITVIKKDNKIPKRQMDAAQKRMKEIQDEDYGVLDVHAVSAVLL